MTFRRFGLFALLPVALFAYACSDDDGGNTTTTGPDAGTDAPTTKPPTGGDDSGTVDPAGDAGADGGDAAPVGCTGNPLAEGDAGVVIDSDGGLKVVAEGRFLDGPQWIDDGAGGAIVYSEVDSQNIVRNAAAGGTRLVLRTTGLDNLPIGNGASGNFIYTALSKQGAAGTGGSILRMLVDGGEPTAFPAGEANSPNDLVASSKGFVYFTDPGYQTDGISTGVYRMSPEGTVTAITKFDGGTDTRADGIALTKDETTLYVGIFDEKRIVKYAVDPSGVASNPTSLTTVFLTDNPTGLAVDQAGNLWVAESPSASDTAPGRVEVFDPNGVKWGSIPFSDARPTGIAFGGADNTTVYITTERGNSLNGTLYSMTSRCAGVR